MLSNSPEIFRLSQSHLNTLTTCPRKFQNTYLEQIPIHSNPEDEKEQTLGSKFHLLMQQKEMGLPIDNLVEHLEQEDEEGEKLKQCIKTFYDISPDIFPAINSQEIFRESEHYRTWQLDNYLFTVIYDLLIAHEDSAYIIDWKTSSKTPKIRELAKNWQTRLYLYILAETSDYLLENISITYAFVQSTTKIKYHKIQYSEKQHQQTTQELEKILNNLNNWLENYQNNVPFPQVQDIKTCKFCPYQSQCQRQKYQNDHPGINHDISNLEKIVEISL